MRTGRYSPLRYPGGKGKLAAFIKAIIERNELSDGAYVEPFAGGAGVACELLAENYVRQIHINDVSPAIFAFWKSILSNSDDFCSDLSVVPLTTDEWDRQKCIFERERRRQQPDLYRLGFATFYLNRTNRSGILNGGIIGGRAQSGTWGIEARFNRGDLIRRIELIASLRSRIKVTNDDALKMIGDLRRKAPARTLIYLDPPYYAKGRQLYLDYYRPDDHRAIANEICKGSQSFNWLVSYDNVVPIKPLYSAFRAVEYDINYSARSASVGSEIIFFDNDLKIPEVGDFLRVTAVSKTALGQA